MGPVSFRNPSTSHSWKVALVQKSTVPVSAIIVGLNEARLLEQCLKGIDFCDEILYFDLNSSDDSLRVAEKFGAAVENHSWVPSGEYVVAEMQFRARHDWVLFIDPDEFIDDSLKRDIVATFSKFREDDKVGSFSAPWQFFFKSRKLYGTPWGGTKQRVFLAHRDRFELLPETHRGRRSVAGFSNIEIASEGSIRHFWSDSWLQLLKKHLRYLATEGGSRYRRGDKLSFISLLRVIPRTFVMTFSNYSDSRDGINGLALNLLWATYKSLSLFELWRVSATSRFGLLGRKGI